MFITQNKSTKSEIASIGSERKNNLEIQPLKWVNLETNAIKILGVFFTYNHELSMKLNFDKRVAQFDILLNIRGSKEI